MKIEDLRSKKYLIIVSLAVALLIHNVNALENNLTINLIDSTTSSISARIGNIGSLSNLPVDTLFVYADTTPSFSSVNCKILYFVLDSGIDRNITIDSLNEATKYYVGVNFHDTNGAWADSVQTDYGWTAISNPLGITLEESGIMGSLLVTFHGLMDLNPVVDTIRLFMKTVNGIFDPSGSANLKAKYTMEELLNDSVKILDGMEGITEYFSAVNVCYFDEVCHFANIDDSNRDTIYTFGYSCDFTSGPKIIDSSLNSISFILQGISNLEKCVQHMFLYYDTNSYNIRVNYMSIPAWDTLSPAEAIAAETLKIEGLKENTKYYVGVAQKDSLGNWSLHAHIDSSWTASINPLGISLSINQPSENHKVIMAISNLELLDPKIDSIRVFWRPNLVKDPFATNPDTVLTLALISDTVKIIMPDNHAQYYVFSVSPGFMEPNKKLHYAPITEANADSIMVDTDEPPNPTTITAVGSTVTTIKIRIEDWQTLWNTDVKRLYLWAHTDYNTLKYTYKALTPAISGSIDSIFYYDYQPVIAGLDTGTAYYIGICPMDTNGNFSDSIMIINAQTALKDTISLEESNINNVPKTFGLSQNCPNPFNPSTIINYQLPIPAYVTFEVYNIKGNLVRTLIDVHKRAGYHYVKWDAQEYSSGIYYFKFNAGNKTFIRKGILMK